MMTRRKVFITAGGAGIGRAIAIAFASQGDDVVVCDVDTKALDRLTGEFPGIRALVCDLSNQQQVLEMVRTATMLLSGLDVLVNNAGISGPTMPAGQLSADDWDKVMQINLNGTFIVTSNALPFLKKSGDGVVINMSSVAGRFG